MSISTNTQAIANNFSHFNLNANKIATSGIIRQNFDIAKPLVENISLENATKAQVVSINTQNEMDKTLLDIKV